jgi:hypothetical protein
MSSEWKEKHGILKIFEEFRKDLRKNGKKKKKIRSETMKYEKNKMIFYQGSGLVSVESPWSFHGNFGTRVFSSVFPPTKKRPSQTVPNSFIENG